MAEESEKRFHAIMDKLFRSPPKSQSTTVSNSTSWRMTSGVKRPNMSSNSSALEPKFKGLQNSLVSGKLVETSLCRPWDRGDLITRLATFKSMTWFGKPKVISAVNCARRGWVNVEMDTLACESCGARLLFSAPSSCTQQQVEKAALVFSLKLDNGHKLLCPWIDNACDENLAQFPPMLDADLVDDYRKRFSALLHLVALPVVSCSAIECMRSPQLEHFLAGNLSVECVHESAGTFRTEYLENECDTDSSALYYQAQKLLSLCGWEPRRLPYIVDCNNQQDQHLIDAVHPDSSHPAASIQNPSISVCYTGTNYSMDVNDDSMASGGTVWDPNSVVLDCRFCGATVGLWTLATVPRPLELFRVVGHTELDGESNYNHQKEMVVYCEGGESRVQDSGNENDIDVGEGPTKSATTVATSSNDRPLELKLTIAGGPPPTKQQFRAIITLPVVGRNLRARIATDMDSGGLLHVRNSDHIHDNNSGKGSQPEYLESSKRKEYDGNHCDSRSNDKLQCLKYDISGQGDKFENDDNCIRSLEGATVRGEGLCESTPDSMLANLPLSVVNLIEDSRVDGALPEIAKSDGMVDQAAEDHSHSQDGVSLTKTSVVPVTVTNGNGGSVEVGFCKQNLETDIVACVEVGGCSHGSTDKLQSSSNAIPCILGKNKKYQALDKAMAFDPIRQHKHFCPWIASVGSAAPGWQQTLSSLQRLKEFSCPFPTNAPSSLIEVDDPITSVRNLFMSPSAKRLKTTPPPPPGGGGGG